VIHYTFSSDILESDRPLILNSGIYTSWLAEVTSRFRVDAIHFSSVDFKAKNREALFIKLNATAFLPDGKKVHGVVLVRGNAVGVLVVLWCKQKPYLLLVKQPRFPIASTDSLEIPAGILDWSKDYRKIALSELEEEAQIQVDDSELIDLTAFWNGSGVEGFACSCGLLDEKIRLYAIEREVTEEELHKMDQRTQQYTDENEWIKTVVLPYEEASHLFVDGKNLIALFMYERWLIANGRSSVLSQLYSK
jgi:ADP-sugar diphosphatase